MSRCFLAFDFGLSRIGVAVGQELTGTAQALKTLQNKQQKPDWQAIEGLIQEWKPDALVIGVPYHMDGTEQDMTHAARKFGRQLHGRFQLPVYETDERLSSREAESEISRQRAAGLRKKTRKGDIDKMAAQIILQSWIQQQEHQKMTDQNEVEDLVKEIAQELKDLLEQRNITNPVMIGIHSGGVWIARKLHQLLGLKEELGTLDISFYRDDFTRIGMHPQVKPTNLPFSIDDKHIILVDDVLHTGRTIRAAMNELFDYGRPASILLAVLVERSGRELPIAASVVGKQLDLEPGEHVKLSGPEPLELVIQEEPGPQAGTST